MADGLAFLKNDDTTETERFIRMIDRFFDCLNVRSLNKGGRKLKPALQPYRNCDDERLKVFPYHFSNSSYCMLHMYW